jgi:cytochrome c
MIQGRQDLPDYVAVRRAAFCILGAGLMSAIPVMANAQMAVPKSAPPSGEKLFGQQCGACHSTKAGETRVGPSLARIIGRKAGSVPGFSYSPALKKSGLTWSEQNLDKWLTNSMNTVRGTSMVYAQADAAKRGAIVDYLKTLSK